MELVAPVFTEYKVSGFSNGKGCHIHAEYKACLALLFISLFFYKWLLLPGKHQLSQSDSNFKYVGFKVTLKYPPLPFKPS